MNNFVMQKPTTNPMKAPISKIEIFFTCLRVMNFANFLNLGCPNSTRNAYKNSPEGFVLVKSRRF
jgi:hypothetical protein